MRSSGCIDSPGQGPGEATRQDPKASPTEHGTVGDNIEMAFGQGATVVTPIEEAEAYATFANRGTRYQPEVADEVVAPDRQGGADHPAQGDRARHDLAVDYTAHAPGPRGCREHQSGTAYASVPQRHRLHTGRLPDRRQDRDGGPHSQHSRRSPTRGSWRSAPTNSDTSTSWWWWSPRAATAPMPPPRRWPSIFNYLYHQPHRRQQSPRRRTPTRRRRTPPATVPAAGAATTGAADPESLLQAVTASVPSGSGGSGWP